MKESRIQVDAPTEIRELLASIERTEDIAFSPDNSRIAIVDFVENTMYLFSVRIEEEASVEPRIAVMEYCKINSSFFRGPHGICFLDNDHFAVGSRYGNVGIFKVPSAGLGNRAYSLSPEASVSGKGFLWAKVKNPGSVDCYKIDDNRYRVMVCNNFWHFISSHVVEIAESVSIENEGVLIENKLRVPDGISISDGNGWIAISNHVEGEVLIYKNDASLNRSAEPNAILRGLVCPHGIRFSDNGRKIYVADAASKYIHIFDSGRDEWSGHYAPDVSIQSTDDAAFYAGRYDTREGGIKGIDVSNSGNIVITTRTRDVLAFYDASKLAASACKVDQDQIAQLSRERDISLGLDPQKILNRSWSIGQRLKFSIIRMRGARKYPIGAWIRLKMAYLHALNKWSRKSVVDATGPALSLTTHGNRTDSVFYTIEAIGRGSVKPSRITLWLGDEERFKNLPQELKRLQTRGLEVCLTEDFGPHTKYFPWVESQSSFEIPMVTADDDMLYPRRWLEMLVKANAAEPSVIHCYRAHRIGICESRLLPYNEWTQCDTAAPSHGNFVTGVSGAIYPPSFLEYLRNQGAKFRDCCPKGDDIWLTVNAIRAGIKIAQLDEKATHFQAIPGSEEQGLFNSNVVAGGNHLQVARTFSDSDVELVRKSLSSEAIA